MACVYTGTFTVSWWYTKERCTGGIYEYMYSHNQFRNSMGSDSSNVNIYLGCEEAGGGFTNLLNPNMPTGEQRAGSTLRFSLSDNSHITGGSNRNIMWDYPIHDASKSQDSVLNVWVHVALSVDVPGQSMKTFIDGVLVPDDILAYYCGSMSACLSVIGDPRSRQGACLNSPRSPGQDSCGEDLPAPAKTIAAGVNRYACSGPGLEWADQQPCDWNAQTQGYWQPATTPADKCGFMNYMDRSGRKTVTNMACPSPQRLDSSTGERFSGLTLGGDIHLGGRSDLNAWRHFNGRMAGVAIAGDAKTEVSCLFGCGHAALPGIATLQADICGTLPTPLVKAPLTSAKCTGTDHVAAGNCAMLGSGASSSYGAVSAFSSAGARFNGDDDYIEIPPIDYGSDSTFTISFWFTKGRVDVQTLSGQGGGTSNRY
eukprot:COSAG04_NODE_4269_length_2197_cov_1.354623_2_plen_426_part_01